MKAAPEKIYLEWYRFGDKKYREWVITPKTNNEPVEYTRTDVFIEKAKSWLENNLQGIVGGSIYVEDFKKYMEEE